MIYLESQPFPYEVVAYAPCCGEIGRVRASLIAIITAAKAYAAAHHLEVWAAASPYLSSRGKAAPTGAS